MDVLTDVLRTLRLRGSLLYRCEQTAPWGLAGSASNYATFHGVVAGSCWLRLAETRQLIALSAGDLILLPHGAAHTLSDAPDTPTLPFLRETRTLGFRLMQGGGAGLATIFLCGVFQVEQPQPHPLLSLLPPLVHIPGENGRPAHDLAAVLILLEAESRMPQLGREVMLQRLTDTLFVQVIRAWVARQAPDRASWLRALADPQVGAALALMHESPARAWSVPVLATEVGMSRSAFSTRFTTLVGEAPLRYLKRWRMQRAAALLQDGDHALQEIAAQVGYESDAAFSKAFKQAFGTAPGAYRQQARSSASAFQ